jgi:hypothetical protein
MTALTAIKEEGSWNGTVSGDPPLGQTTLAEISGLLREIRDLQKAHFERYKEFTGAIMAAEKTRAQDAGRLQFEQLHYQEELQRAAFQRQLISWAVWGGVFVLCLFSLFAFQLMTAFEN